MNTWRVTFGMLNDDGAVVNTISVKVKSNNEYYAREKAKMALHNQYHYLECVKEGKYKIMNAKLIERFF